MPALQLWPIAHFTPQPAQLDGSLRVSTQRPLQYVVGGGHRMAPMHEPCWQICPGAQMFPHLPQFSWSDMAFVQRPSQGIRGAAQPRLQAPAVQTSLALHRVPQPPQWLGSVLVSTHAPAHSTVPAGQVVTQPPALQICPGLQRVPHAPQLIGSVWVSAQTPAQSVWPA
jgi:hypothetical protein